MPGDRFFAATLDAGGLHVRGLGAAEPWDRSRLEYSDAADVDLVMGGGLGDRKIDTPEELRAVLGRENAPNATPRKVWIHERYLDEVRRYHEQRARRA